MIDLQVFFNTRIEDASVKNYGLFAWAGDKSLAPFRYLFNGKTIRIQTGTSSAVEIFHVASFHKNGARNKSKANAILASSPSNMIKTALAVIFLIPGLLIGTISKALAYISSNMRERHGLAKLHLTPTNREIKVKVTYKDEGKTEVNETVTANNLYKEIQKLSKKPKHRPTDVLIINGDGEIEIGGDIEPPISILNPMKLMLVNVKSANSLLGKLESTGKWRINTDVTSVEEAYKMPLPSRGLLSGKRFHMAFVLPQRA
jgi:hypothetical protein